MTQLYTFELTLPIQEERFSGKVTQITASKQGLQYFITMAIDLDATEYAAIYRFAHRIIPINGWATHPMSHKDEFGIAGVFSNGNTGSLHVITYEKTNKPANSQY